MNEVLITSSILIVALLILRTIFAKKVRRTWIYAAWLLVALRLLVPVQVGELSFSVLTMAKPLTETVQTFSDYRVIGQNEREAEIEVAKDYIEQDQTAFTPQVQEYIQKKQAEGTSVEEIATALVKTQGSSLYAQEMQSQVAEKVESQTKFVSLGEAATIVWLMGVAAMAIWLAVGNLQLGRSLKSTEKTVECESPIPVYISETAVSPCLFGLFRPAVYLTPESAADEQVMRHVVTHELTHYTHKDHIWALVRCICLCVYWFNPLVWVAAWFSRRDCELACDEGALKHLDEAARIDYGKALLQVASQTSVSGRLMLTATTMAETKKQLKERVDFIVKKPKWSAFAAVCMLLVCAIVASCAAAGPAGAQTTEPIDPTESADPTEPEAVTKWVYLKETVHEETLGMHPDRTTVYSYDENGYPTGYEGYLGEQLNSHYTVQCILEDRMLKVLDGEGYLLYEYAFDEAGRLLMLTYYGNDLRKWEYTYEGDKLVREMELEYRKENNFTYHLYDIKDIRYTYDAQGRKTASHTYEYYANTPQEMIESHCLRGYVLYSYGTDDRPIRAESYGADGTLQNYIEYSYDDANRVKTAKVYHSFGRGDNVSWEVDTIYTTSYDEAGNVIREEVQEDVRFGDGPVTVITYTYIYLEVPLDYFAPEL